MYYDIIINFIWGQKINILASIFLGLTIYSYFYKRKIAKNEIIIIKNKTKRAKEYINNLTILKMSNEETFQLKEILSRAEDNANRVESEFRKEFKGIHEKIDNKISAVIQVLTDYIVSNDKRVGELEKNDAVQNAKMLIYVSIAVYILGIGISLYMSFK
jgi:hypothetical protein